jgi:hypothetical protein
VDVVLNFKTRNVLCQPVRSHRGGGNIVGVVQMLNKLGDDETFENSDQETLELCVERVANELSEKFSNLVSLVEKFSSLKIFFIFIKINMHIYFY